VIRNAPENRPSMLHLVVDHTTHDPTAPTILPGDYGAWAGYRIPDDRADWHPLVRRFYEYWLSISPPGCLPGRQHISPEGMVPLLSRLWMLDVHRDPLRFRFRLCGTEIVRSFRREVTGCWLDEVHPQSVLNIEVRDRFRFAAEMGGATWRRGPVVWDHDRDRRTLENCIVPLAADGHNIDKLLGLVVVFDGAGRQL